MKQSGKCPKCGSFEIWNNTHMKPRPTMIEHILVNDSFWKRKWAREEIYVCIGCGYEERFVNNEGLEIIREYGSREIG